MPPKNKKSCNGFSMFMREQQSLLAKEAKRQHSFAEMQNICAGPWKSLSQAERERYNAMAKDEKRRQRGLSINNNRMDNQGQIIAHRKSAAEEEAKRRAIDSQAIEQTLKETDVREQYFHIISFQVLYEDRSEDVRRPVEIGVVRFSLKSGIIKFMHEMINPGSIPQGNTSVAVKHQELTHGIPLNYEHATNDYADVWKRLEKFLVEDPEYDDIPPLYCLSPDHYNVEACLDFLYDNSGVREPKRICRLYCLEDLLTALIKQSDKVTATPAAFLTRDIFLQHRWDYNSSIKCNFHAELDNIHCSLSIVRRYSFALFDLLADILDFELTGNHLPDETSMPYTIQQPVSFGKVCPRENASWRDRRDREDFTVTSPARREPPQQYSHQRAAAFGGQPRVPRQEIHLSDDDYEEEEVLYTEEVKSTTDQYSLKELRKPKTQSALQGAGHNIVMTAGRGRGFSPDSGIPARPMGHLMQAAGDTGVYMGSGRGYPTTGGRGFSQPPPGFAPPPGFSARPPGSVVAPPSAWQMNQDPSPAFTSAPARPGGPSTPIAQRGRQAGRGRGMPPQVKPGPPVGAGLWGRGGGY